MAVNFFGTRKDNINLFQASEFMREAREKSTTDEHENSNGKLFERKKANKHERVAVEMKHSGLQELVSKKFARRKKQNFFSQLRGGPKKELGAIFLMRDSKRVASRPIDDFLVRARDIHPKVQEFHRRRCSQRAESFNCRFVFARHLRKSKAQYELS